MNHAAMMKVNIRTHHWLAAAAARKLGVQRVAMVVGNTIFLWGCSRDEFLADEKWVRHELAHVLQYRQYGLLRFLGLYLLSSIWHGYAQNRFERAARAQEMQATLQGWEFN